MPISHHQRNLKSSTNHKHLILTNIKSKPTTHKTQTLLWLCSIKKEGNEERKAQWMHTTNESLTERKTPETVKQSEIVDLFDLSTESPTKPTLS
jgi:hypothetical protein